MTKEITVNKWDIRHSVPPCGSKLVFNYTLCDLQPFVESPQVTVPHAEMLIGLGQTVVLECRVTGVPHPNVIWYKGRQTSSPKNVVETDFSCIETLCMFHLQMTCSWGHLHFWAWTLNVALWGFRRLRTSMQEITHVWQSTQPDLHKATSRWTWAVRIYCTHASKITPSMKLYLIFINTFLYFCDKQHGPFCHSQHHIQYMGC